MALEKSRQGIMCESPSDLGNNLVPQVFHVNILAMKVVLGNNSTGLLGCREL